MIEIKNLTKCYGDRKAIDNLSFNVKKGEVVGFLGPNGAGKTTTMKIITGFMAPTSGAVKIAGFDVFEDPIEVKRRIGYLPETPPVYGDMVVKEYLEFVAKLKGVPSENVKKLVDRAIEKTQLGQVSHRLIQNLSKGFRQRVGLAQAIASDPEILILDEPTVGLDPRQVAEIRTLLKELRGEHTIILSTHILPEVQATCERVIIISSGKIVAEDTLMGLGQKLTGGASVQLRVRRHADELAVLLRSLKGITSVDVAGQSLRVHGAGSEEIIEAVSEAAVSKRAGLLELSHPATELEDIFIQLTSAN
ncbi:MAG: ABC transporter ATP-binding protein [Bdellovibrionales bacterium]|nr:ABC transporter ATP-binding protein [Bdellovibrionales bacterium]